MGTKKTSIQIDSLLWERVKKAAREWAEECGIPPERNTTRWVSMTLKRAVDEKDSPRPTA